MRRRNDRRAPELAQGILTTVGGAGVLPGVADAAMTTYLFKTEPDEFSWDDLVRAGRSPWNGVTNNTALLHLRTCSPSDETFIYHTGSERRIVGKARIVCAAYEDPARPGRTARHEPKFAVVDVVPVSCAKTPLTLAAMKADHRFSEFVLVRQPRLSVMPVPAKLDRMIRTLTGL